MKIPVVLTVVHVDVRPDGTLDIDVDNQPYAAPQPVTRTDLRRVLDEITGRTGEPVRVEIREADGTTYDDIALPPEAPPTPENPPAPQAPGITGAGFQPGEEVAVAYVLCHHTADGTGAAAVTLPPAVLARIGTDLLLIGTTSQTLARIETTA